MKKIALVVEKPAATSCAAVCPARVPAKLLPLSVKRFTPEKVFASVRRVEEAAPESDVK
jgi:hypothetical protein